MAPELNNRNGYALMMGFGFVVGGIVTNLLAARQHLRMLRRLRSHEEYQPAAFEFHQAFVVLVGFIARLQPLRFALRCRLALPQLLAGGRLGQ